MMDGYVATHLPLLSLRGAGRTPSWHSYTFTVSTDSIDALQHDLDRIDAHDWRIKVRYNPDLGRDEMREFLAGSHRPAGGRSRCHALRTRLDVLPSGEAVSCKFFPEFTMGDLRRDAVDEVWHGRRFAQMRDTIGRCGLMPVCAKCNLLYTRGD